jgi:hypothetical protein
VGGGGDLSGKHAAKGIEAALVLGGDKLGHIKHEGAVGVAIPDGRGIDVVQGSLVQVVHPVLLSLSRGGQMPDHHLQQSLQSRRCGDSRGGISKRGFQE